MSNDTSKKGSKTTARDRHMQFLKTTYVSGSKLFCDACNIVLDHHRKSSVDNHMKTDKHAQRLEAKSKSNPEQGPSAKKQCTLDHFQGPDTIAAKGK